VVGTEIPQEGKGRWKVSTQLYPPNVLVGAKKKGGASSRLARYFMHVELHVCRAAHRGDMKRLGSGW